MANDFTCNPLIFTDTGTAKQVSGFMKITKIRWVSGSSGAAGDQCVLKNAAGNVMFDHTLGTAKDSIETDFMNALHTHGLFLATLTHGTVYVYIVPGTQVPTA